MPTTTDKKPAPPRKRVSSVPVAARPPARRDWWPWNLMAVLVGGIFAVGLGVWGMRGIMSQQPPAPPTATALAAAPTPPPAQGTPLVAGVSTPTLAAPAALTTGPYAAGPPIQSSVGNPDQVPKRPTLPPQIPAPQIAFSADAYDWGQISAAGVVTTMLTVANVGNYPLLVDQLLSSCGCLSATLAGAQLPVGYRTQLVVSYDPRLDSTPGQVTRTLTILSNAAADPVHELTFRATVP